MKMKGFVWPNRESPSQWNPRLRSQSKPIPLVYSRGQTETFPVIRLFLGGSRKPPVYFRIIIRLIDDHYPRRIVRDLLSDPANDASPAGRSLRKAKAGLLSRLESRSGWDRLGQDDEMLEP